jgi:hypothetical protein
MAKLSLTKRELASGELPLLCMKCGKTNAEPMKKKLVFWPLKVRLIILFFALLCGGWLGVVAYFALRHEIIKMPAKLPMCSRHRNQRTMPFLIIFGILLVGAFITFTPMALTDKMSAEFIEVLFYVGLGVMAFAILIGGALLSGEIVIESVDGENVTLTNISDEFIAAVTEQRKNAPVPVVEDIAVDLVHKIAELPQGQSRWRNLDLPD